MPLPKVELNTYAKPNGHFFLLGWFCFWCSTRLLMSIKMCSIWLWIICILRNNPRSTPLFLMIWVIALNINNGTKWPLSNGILVSFLVFDSAFGRHRQWLKLELFRTIGLVGICPLIQFYPSPLRSDKYTVLKNPYSDPIRCLTKIRKS